MPIAFASKFNYREQIADPTFVQPDPANPVDIPLIPNPESKEDFMKRQIQKFIAETYKTQTVRQSSNAAASAAAQSARADVEAKAMGITVQ